LFKRKLLLAATAASALIGMSIPATAADWADEIRLGVYDHNSNLFATRHETSSPDINAEMLFKSPAFLSPIWSPRPQLGVNISTGSGTSIAYAGLAWDYNLTDSLFVEASFGGAIHNGETDHRTANRQDYGCRVMFHENASVGWRFDAQNSLMLTLDHMSNASLCSPNPGLTDIGVRYGFSF
jgi:lipid A 3-O-deacylase